MLSAAQENSNSPMSVVQALDRVLVSNLYSLITVAILILQR